MRNIPMRLLIIGDIILIFGAVLGIFGALITSYNLPVHFLELFLVLFFVTVFFALAANYVRKIGLPVLSALVLIYIIFNLTEILSGARSVIFIITNELSLWTAIPMFFSDSIPVRDEIITFFIAFGMIYIILLTISIAIHFNTIATIIITIPVALVTFILLGSQPNFGYLIILLAVYLALIFGNVIKSCNINFFNFYKDEDSDISIKERERTLKTIMILSSLVLATLLLVTASFIAPQNSRTHSNIGDRISVSLRMFMSHIGFASHDLGVGWPSVTDGRWYFNTGISGISDAGIREIYNISLLEIYVTEPGIFYLRGFSLERFDGRSWYSVPAAHRAPGEELSRKLPAFIAAEHNRQFPEGHTTLVEILILHTGDATTNISYIPYHSTINPIFDDDYYVYYLTFFHNPRRSIIEMYNELRSLIETYNEPDSIFIIDSQLELYEAWLYENNIYRSIDITTAENLRRVAVNVGIDINADRDILVRQVADFISSSGRYTLNAPRTPVGVDFAMHFLEVSRRGYCIHFATTATLMLRALDVPARFVTGYLISVPERKVGEIITLTDRNAHAWVEVYFNNIGWLPVEVTPASAPGGTDPDAVSIEAPQRSFPTDFRPHFQNGLHYYFDEEWFTGEFFEFEPGITVTTPQITPPANPIGIFIRIFSTLATAIILLVSRMIVVRKLRSKRFTQANTNAAVISIHRYITRLGYRNKMPDRIEELALKACFSQHTITQSERDESLLIATKLRKAFYENETIIYRLYYDLILVL